MSSPNFFKSLFIFSLLTVLTSCNSDKKKNNEENPMVISSGSNESAVTKETDQNSQKYEAGKKVYAGLCITCHMTNGKGIVGNFPPLDGSNWIKDKRQKAIHAVKFGLNGEIEVNGTQYNNVMPPPQLSDQQVTDVLNYVMHSWSNNVEKPVTLEEVKAVKKE